MKTLILLVAAALPMAAAVDGVVMNGTTGQPQPGAVVALYKLGTVNGLEHVAEAKAGADGKFTIDYTIQPGGPHLIQTTWDGITYNHMLPPGSPTSGVSVEVYNAETKPGDAKITTHMMVLQPGTSSLQINENYVFNNTGKLAYNNKDTGTLRFFLPEAAGGQVRVTVTAPQGMPIQQLAEKTSTPNVYKLNFPIKPGETNMEVAYSLPISSPGTLTGKVLQTDTPTRLVAPNGVTLSGDDVVLLGREPNTQAGVYELKKKDFSVQVEGTGSIDMSGGQQDDTGTTAEDEGQGLQIINPRIYDRYLPILGLSFLILLLGFVLLYRKQEAAPAAAGSPSTQRPQKGKRK